MGIENKATTAESSQFAQFEVAFAQLDKDKIFNEIVGRFTNGKQSIKLYEKHKEPNTLFRTVRFLHPKDIEVIRKIVEEYVPSAQSDNHSIEKKALTILLTQMAKCEIVLESTFADNTRVALAPDMLAEKLKSGTYVLKNKNGEVLEYSSIESISPKGLRGLIDIAKESIEEKISSKEKQVDAHNTPQTVSQKINAEETTKKESPSPLEEIVVASAIVENTATEQSLDTSNKEKEEEKILRKNEEKHEEIAESIKTESFKKEIIKEETEKKVEAKELVQEEKTEKALDDVTSTDQEKENIIEEPLSENESVS